MACISQTGTPVTGGQSIRLGTMYYQLYASPAFIARYISGSPSPEKVMQSPGLLYDEYDVTLLSDYQQTCFNLAPSFSSCHWYPSSHGFVKMAVDGVAWALLPTLQVVDEVKKGELGGKKIIVLARDLPSVRSRTDWPLHRLTTLCLSTRLATTLARRR